MRATSSFSSIKRAIMYAQAEANLYRDKSGQRTQSRSHYLVQAGHLVRVARWIPKDGVYMMRVKPT